MAGSESGWPESWVNPDQAQANNLQDEVPDDGRAVIGQPPFGGGPFSRILAALLRSPFARSPLFPDAHTTTSSVAAATSTSTYTSAATAVAETAATTTAHQIHHQLHQRHAPATPLVESLFHRHQQQQQQLLLDHPLDESSLQHQTSALLVQPSAEAAEAGPVGGPSPFPLSNLPRRVVGSAADVVRDVVDTVTTQLEGLLQQTVAQAEASSNNANSYHHNSPNTDSSSSGFLSISSSLSSSSSITTSSSASNSSSSSNSSNHFPSLHRAILEVGRTAAEAASDATTDQHHLASLSAAAAQTGAATSSLNSASAAAAAAAAAVDPLSPLNATLTHDYVGGLLDGEGSDVLNATFTARPTAHVAYNDNANSWWRNFIPRPSMSPEEVRAQYYATYDPMTGVRIAATLGAIMSLFALFLIFKARCKSIRSRLNL